MTRILLSYRSAAQATSLSVASIKRRVASGKFPKPVQVSPGRVAFVRAEVEEWAKALPRAGA